MEKAEAKSVMVSQRNKVLKVPATNERGDLNFLEEVFRKEFQFDTNVSLVITFQRFDRDWEEYEDLDDQSVLLHKDKLRTVVTPLLTTPCTETEASEVSNFLSLSDVHIL